MIVVVQLPVMQSTKLVMCELNDTVWPRHMVESARTAVRSYFSFTTIFTDQPNGDYRIKAGQFLLTGASDGGAVGINDWTKIPACAPYTYAGAACPIIPLANPITATSMGR